MANAEAMDALEALREAYSSRVDVVLDGDAVVIGRQRFSAATATRYRIAQKRLTAGSIVFFMREYLKDPKMTLRTYYRACKDAKVQPVQTSAWSDLHAYLTGASSTSANVEEAQGSAEQGRGGAAKVRARCAPPRCGAAAHAHNARPSGRHPGAGQCHDGQTSVVPHRSARGGDCHEEDHYTGPKRGARPKPAPSPPGASPRRRAPRAGFFFGSQDICRRHQVAESQGSGQRQGGGCTPGEEPQSVLPLPPGPPVG